MVGRHRHGSSVGSVMTLQSASSKDALIILPSSDEADLFHKYAGTGGAAKTILLLVTRVSACLAGAKKRTLDIRGDEDAGQWVSGSEDPGRWANGGWGRHAVRGPYQNAVRVLYFLSRSGRF